MQRRGKAWTVQDRYGDWVYLTWERWDHIVTNHPDVAPFFDEVRQTIHQGSRRQDRLNPYKFFYRKAYIDLPDDHDLLVAVVAVNVTTGDHFVMTAYFDNEP